jgi:hypothetical protein
MPSTLKTDASEVTLVPPPAKELLKWKALSRPFKKRDRDYFTTIAAIVFLLAVILFFLKEWLLIVVILSLMFLAYVLATVPPSEETYKITTRGVSIGEKTYPWNQLIQFWFEEKQQTKVLNIKTVLNFPGELHLVLGDQKQEKIKETVEKYLVFEKPKPTLFDKAANWLKEKFPLE